MNHESLRIKFSCSTCMFCVPEDEAKGNCHAGHPTDDNGFPEVVLATGWCGDHQQVTTEVPNVVGMAVPVAVALLGTINIITVGVITRVSGEVVDTVISQSPIAGSPATANTVVNLIATEE